LTAKLRQAFTNAEGNNEDIDLDALDEELSAVLGDEGAGDDNNDDDDDENDPLVIGDAVSKSLSLIRQVCDTFSL
jgi:hypothetical protein